MIVHTNTPPAYQFVQYMEVQKMIATAVEPLRKELILIKSLQSEWVDTKEAMRITGIKQAQTLKAERERPNTLLVVKFEGTAQKSPRYLRASLVAYNDAKTRRRYVGRNLAADSESYAN